MGLTKRDFQQLQAEKSDLLLKVDRLEGEVSSLGTERDNNAAGWRDEVARFKKERAALMADVDKAKKALSEERERAKIEADRLTRRAQKAEAELSSVTTKAEAEQASLQSSLHKSKQQATALDKELKSLKDAQAKAGRSHALELKTTLADKDNLAKKAGKLEQANSRLRQENKELKENLKKKPKQVTKTVKVPVEKIVKIPVEKIVEVPVERIVKVPVESKVEVPVEKIVYRDKPVKLTIDERMKQDREVARRIQKAEERAERAEAALAESGNGSSTE